MCRDIAGEFLDTFIAVLHAYTCLTATSTDIAVAIATTAIVAATTAIASATTAIAAATIPLLNNKIHTHSPHCISHLDLLVTNIQINSN